MSFDSWMNFSSPLGFRKIELTAEPLQTGHSHGHGSRDRLYGCSAAVGSSLTRPRDCPRG